MSNENLSASRDRLQPLPVRSRSRGEGIRSIGAASFWAAGRGRWLASTIVVAIAVATRGAALAFGNLPPVRLGGVARDEHNGRSWLGAGTSSSASSGLGGGLDQGLVV